jgi:esterase/lipase
MKIIKIFLTFFLLTFATLSFAAGTSSSDKKPSYKNAVKLIEAAKKYESKDKMDKALKRYKKAQKILLELDKKKTITSRYFELFRFYN